ncbi:MULTISPECIES: hypothetical protein [unclassified Rhodococcus (in: high G+C Gram-positive bacteria)]|nr:MULTISPECIES: hypothetical protein [unclassified Rhodococcus (in: high G+C Gram-positive bacteria)]
MIPTTAYTVQQVSTVVTIPGVDPAPPAAENLPGLADLGTIFGS